MAQALLEKGPSNPETRFGHNSAVVDGQMFVWGGCVVESQEIRFLSHEIIWSLHLAEKSWAKRLATFKHGNDLPRPSAGSTIAIFRNHQRNHQIYQFGGAHRPSLSSPVKRFNDLHILDGMTLEWKQILPKGRTPDERSYCGMCVLDDHLAMMGGYHGPGDFRNNLWTFSLNEELWTEVECRGKGPSPRCDHSFTAIDKDRAILIGGIIETGDGCQDSFILNFKNKEWTEIFSTAVPDRPTPRYHHSAVITDISGKGQQLFLFWGCDRLIGKPVSNAVIIDLATLNCRKIDIPDIFPSFDQTVCCLFSKDKILHFLRFGGIYGRPRPGAPFDILKWNAGKLEKVDINETSLSVSDQLTGIFEKRTTIDMEKNLSPSDFVYDEETDFISAGSFGEVFKAKMKKTDETVALKILFRRRRTADESALLKKESSVLLGIRPFLHIVKFIGLCDSPRRYVLVMEFVGGGDLTELLASSIREVENWAVRLDISCQVAMGMAHLHGNSPCVIHLDLKPGNVLIEKMAEMGKRPFLCKICDFGLSKMSGVSTLTDDRDDGSTPAGTIAYLAPERYFAYGPGTKEEKMQIAKKSDAFSYGVLLWEILERRPPFKGLKKDAIQIHIKSGQPLPVPEKKAGAPKGYVDLVDACSNHDPKIRPTFAQVIEILLNIQFTHFK